MSIIKFNDFLIQSSTFAHASKKKKKKFIDNFSNHHNLLLCILILRYSSEIRMEKLIEAKKKF